MGIKSVDGKIMALAIALIMCMSFGVTAFADKDPSYTIKIDNAVIGETYSAYKVFDVTYSGENTSAGTLTPATTIPGDPDGRSLATAYSYTIKKNSTFWTDLTTNDATNNPVTVEDGVYTLSKFGIKFVPTTTADTYNVLPTGTAVTPAQAADLAAFLATKLDGKSKAASKKATGTADDTKDYTLVTTPLELDVTSAGAGYYFVDTTTGSLCSLDTTEPEATIREKNSIPSETKEVSDAANGTFGADTTIKVGDTAYFKIEVTDSKGTDKKVTVHDTMSDALTLDLNSFAIKVDGSDVATTAYTIKYNSDATVKNDTEAGTKVTSATLSDGCTFEIEFTDTYIQNLAENKKIVITYEAELNAKAVTADPFQINKTHIDYSEQSTVDKEVTVKTYEVDVVKTDGDNKVLDGATFNLYDAATGGNKYNLVKVSDGNYRIAVSTDASTAYAEKLEPKDGKLNIKGLENGDYYLEEVDHPEGYNPLTERKKFTITDANSNAILTGTGSSAVYNPATENQAGVQVINQSGTQLPSTGGIGTTIFYVIGAVLVVGAGVLLVTRRRMRAE